MWRLEIFDNDRAWLTIRPAILLIPLAFLLGCNEISDYDFWWHLRTGQLIPELGVPRTDWFSFTEPNRPWIDVHWGFQSLIAPLYAAFGVGGIVFAKGVVAAATMAVALTAYRQAWPSGGQFWVMLAALALMSSRFYERPEMLTLFFTSIYLSVLLNAEDRPRLLWLLPVVQVAWANVQGLFAFGPILLGMYWVQVFLNWQRYGRTKWILAVVTLLVMAACAVSPYGVHNAVFVSELWQKIDPVEGELYKSTIGELQDVRAYVRDGGWSNGYVWLLFGLIGLGAVGVIVRWREILLRRELFRLLPIVAFTWLGLAALRNGSHFALVVGTMSAWNLGPTFVRRRSAPPPAWTWRNAAMACVLPTLACMAIAVYFVGGRWAEWMGGHRRFGFDLHPEQFSFAAMDVCSTPGMPDRAAIFHLGQSGPFIYTCGPEQKVFMDPRLEVHSRPMFEQYLELNRQLDQGGGIELLAAYGIPLVVASSQQRSGIQATLLTSPDWQCVYWDEVVGVFMRRNWSLPDGVEAVDFRERLWSGNVGPMQWTARPKSEPHPWRPYIPRPGVQARASDALIRLARGLQRDSANADNLRLTLWCAARSAVPVLEEPYAPEAWRSYGLALVALGEVEKANQDQDAAFDPYAEGMQAIGMGVLHAIVEEMPNENSVANFYQNQLAAHGAVDRSLELLERLTRKSVWNASVRRPLEEMDDIIVERRRVLDRRNGNLPEPPMTWEDFVAYREAGKLGALIDFVKSNAQSIEPLTLDQRVKLAQWGLAIGEVVLAPEQILSAGTEASAEARIVVELLQCVANGSMAWNWDQLGSEIPVGCHLLNAARSVLRGDKNGFQGSLQRADSAEATEVERMQRKHLQDLR